MSPAPEMNVKVTETLMTRGDVVTKLAQLPADSKVKIKLGQGPVKAGSFAVVGVGTGGLRDYADGKLYDGDGLLLGSIDYHEPSVMVSVTALRDGSSWEATYSVARKAKVAT